MLVSAGANSRVAHWFVALERPTAAELGIHVRVGSPSVKTECSCTISAWIGGPQSSSLTANPLVAASGTWVVCAAWCQSTIGVAGSRVGSRWVVTVAPLAPPSPVSVSVSCGDTSDGAVDAGLHAVSQCLVGW